MYLSKFQRSKRSDIESFGRNDANIKVIIPTDKPIAKDSMSTNCPNIDTSIRKIEPGDFVVAQITGSSTQVLKGVPLYHTTIGEYLMEQKKQLKTY